MARHLQRLDQLDEGQLQLVMNHPYQREAPNVIAGLLAELRGLHDWGAYHDFQSRLLGQILHVEELFAAASRSAKRSSKGRVVDESPSGDWELERLVYKRIARQLRSVGDALAWRLFKFDRRRILAYAMNSPAGHMHDKTGLSVEMALVEDAWHSQGVFTLVHDGTNCLRISDLTRFKPDRYEVVEAKTRGSPTPPQRDRMKRLAAYLNEELTGSPNEIVVARQQLRTALPTLGRHLAAARANAVSAFRLGRGWIVSAEDPTATTSAERTALLEQMTEKANIGNSVRVDSYDETGFEAGVAPFTIYPFDPETCALLTCDLLIYRSMMDWERFVGAFEDRGFSTHRVVPDGCGDLDTYVPVLRISKGGHSSLVDSGVIHQMLMELIDPRLFAAAFDDQRSKAKQGEVGSANFVFGNERATWR